LDISVTSRENQREGHNDEALDGQMWAFMFELDLRALLMLLRANPTVEDVELLKQNALPSEAGLPLKDLAVAIIAANWSGERITANGETHQLH
jgi:hypothetical protein